MIQVKKVPARIALAVILMMATLSSASAYHFTEYLIDIWPEEDATLEVLRFSINNDQDQPLTEGNYTINANVKDVKVYDDRGLLQYIVATIGESSTISYQYRNPLFKGNSSSITISFRSASLIGKSTYTGPNGSIQEDRVISTAFAAPAPVRNLRVGLHLPDGAWLARSLSNPGTITGSPVQPLDGNIVSNGTSLSVIWERSNLSKGDRFDIFVAYRFSGPSIKLPIWVVILTLMLGLGVGALCTFVVLRRRTAETTTQQTLALLEEGERKVLKIIMDAGGEIRQDDLMKATGYSRARVSQLVTHLEKLGLIRKERFERTNRLFLTGEVREA